MASLESSTSPVGWHIYIWVDMHGMWVVDQKQEYLMHINVNRVDVLIFLESEILIVSLRAPHVQVKALCEKAKEILMEESNVQVSHTISSLLTVVQGIFRYRCARIFIAGSKGCLNLYCLGF